MTKDVLPTSKCLGVVGLFLILSESILWRLSLEGHVALLNKQRIVENHESKRTRREAPLDPQFVFFMGLEGTGHHLMHSLVHKSPVFTRVSELGLQKIVVDLQKGMYNHYNKSDGLWSLPCDAENKYTRAKDPRPVDRVASLMRNITDTLDNSSTSSSSGPVAVPLNCISFGNSEQETGEMSYPNFKGECSALQYPDVGLLEESCAAANVTCTYIYLHRDPYRIIRSTTERRRFHSRNRALQLYKGLSQVLQSQLNDVAPFLTMCHDYDGPNGVGWELGKLLGWTNKTAFDSMVNETVVRHPPLTDEDRNTLIPWELEPYMTHFIKAYEQTRETCLSLVATASL